MIPTATTPPVLLTMAGYSGTLAAARCLGEAGIPVTVASDRAALPAAWSKWASRRVRCPDSQDPARFMEWLIDFGSRHPGHVLYPTCDDFAFLFAQHAEELRKWFFLYQPSADTILALLDKSSLAVLARGVGLDTPVTYFADDDAGLERVAREGPFPLLIKPRTQLMFRTRNKGIRVDRRADLVGAYRAYVRANTYLPPLLAQHPDVARPMLQEYTPEAEDSIYSVAGFIDETGELFAARASRKTLQRPRRLGVGLCFEEAPLDREEASAIATLCMRTGYFGVFEAEFVPVDGRRLLIDFNPRYYNQMALEIARGLPLPLLVYLAAVGDREALRRSVCAARSGADEGGAAWCHGFVFRVMVAMQRASGGATVAEVRRWRSWYAAHRARMVDAAFERHDVLPGVIAALLELRGAIRHPRGFYRSFVMNR